MLFHHITKPTNIKVLENNITFISRNQSVRRSRMGPDSVQLILLQKHEAGFEHQAASMPNVPPAEKARIVHILLRYLQQKPQSTNNRLNTAPEFGGNTREASPRFPM
jgi:hypothetical protein